MQYIIIFIILTLCEILYFKLADKFNIIDKPNARSSHSKVVIRGGGIIFLLGIWIWSAFYGFLYPWFLVAVTLAAGVSFIDDIHSLPDSVRLVAQFVAMGLMFYQLDMIHLNMWWVIIVALIVCVGATNIYNFMDGINGITAGYSFAVLVPLLILNSKNQFVSESLIVVVLLSAIAFGLFNFRPKNKAKCFAGDVGSVGIAFILLFLIGKLIMKTGDVTWLCFLLVYGIDGCLTICHRIMLHENLGEAHRKHMYQIMSNELGMSHVAVSLIYMAVQLVISLAMVYFVPSTALAHWLFLLVSVIVLAAVYVIFMKKNYHLHTEYLLSIENK